MLKTIPKNYSYIVILTAIFVLGLFIGMYDHHKPHEAKDEWHNRHICKRNMLMIRESLRSFAIDYKGKLPTDLNELFPHYITGKEFFVCPSQRDNQEPADNLAVSYRYLVGGKNLDDLLDDSIILTEFEHSHNQLQLKNGDIFPKGHHMIRKKKGVEFITAN